MIIYLLYIPTIIIAIHSHTSYGSYVQNPIAQCIYNNDYRSFSVNTNQNILLVDLLPNAAHNCINPNFPAIHITSTAPSNVWLHIVYTDSKSFRWKQFVDYYRTSHNAPFYATYSDFFDAPLWTYSPNHYPLHYWQGHVYALYINRNDKTIHFTGGVNWGFKLSIPNIKPIALTPSNITIKQYKKDWSKFIQHFPQFSGYKIVY